MSANPDRTRRPGDIVPLTINRVEYTLSLHLGRYYVPGDLTRSSWSLWRSERDGTTHNALFLHQYRRAGADATSAARRAVEAKVVPAVAAFLDAHPLLIEVAAMQAARQWTAEAAGRVLKAQEEMRTAQDELARATDAYANLIGNGQRGWEEYDRLRAESAASGV